MDDKEIIEKSEHIIGTPEDVHDRVKLYCCREARADERAKAQPVIKEMENLIKWIDTSKEIIILDRSAYKWESVKNRAKAAILDYKTN